MNVLKMNMEKDERNEKDSLKHENLFCLQKNENNNNAVDMLPNITCKWSIHQLRLAAAFAFEAFEAPSAASRFLGGGFFRVDTALPIPAAGRPG